MSAALYVGRVGSLAVALGVGVAIFTGHGIASATTDSEGGTSAGGSSSSSSGPSTDDSPKDKPKHQDASSDGTSATTVSASESSSNTTASTGRTRNGAAHDRIKKRVSSEVSDTKSPEDDPSADTKIGSVQKVSLHDVASISAVVKPPAVDDPDSSIVPPSPSAPPTGPNPIALTALAASRREIGVDAVAAAPTGPITYAPTPTLVNDTSNPLSGVINSSVQGTDANGLPLNYTVVAGPSGGGKVSLNASTGTFVFLPNASTLTSSSRTEDFSVLVHEVTPFVSSLAPLQAVPVLGSFVNQALVQLYQTPVLNQLLAPLIGYSTVTSVTVNLNLVNPTGAPIAFTTFVTSFDGTQISTNWFPAIGLKSIDKVPTLLNSPGLGTPGNTDPTWTIDPGSMTPGLAPLRAAGYNVVTWDPRGEFASGGVLQIDNPAFEGLDTKAIIDWVAKQPNSTLDVAANDPRVGMVGGSYGGGIQLVTAAIDQRVDAIIPTIAWNSLVSSLYPKDTFKTAFGSLLLLSLVQAGATINPALYPGFLSGAALGTLSPSDVALLASSGPGSLVSAIKAPTLLIQGTADTLFPLQQAVINSQLLAAMGTPVKMIWFCGGHGVCLDPVDQAAQANSVLADQLAWLAQYVKRDGTINTIPAFQWTDQQGNFFSSNVLPTSTTFQGAPVTATSGGGVLPIVPLQGGSGPQPLPAGAPLGLEYALASKAATALNVDVAVPAGTQIVGAPALTFTYAGLGTSRALYAQIVDEDTGRVLGNIVTPIPVILDGQTRTVSLSLGQLADVAYTAPVGGGRLTVQLVATATPFANVTAVGVVNVSNMTVTLPAVAPGIAKSEPAAAAQGSLIAVA